MSRRTKISIIIIIIVLILLALALFFWRWTPNEPATVPVVINEPTIEVDEPEPNGPKEMLPEEKAEPVDVSLETLARTFGERYGSYSNESDFANLYDLMPLMTNSMQADTEDLIERVVVAEVY
ncbi:MAG: hypothetical protein V1695_02530, partial [Candidatus Uhrbacteria bacterium]